MREQSNSQTDLPAHKQGIIVDLFTFLKIGIVAALLAFLITNGQLAFAMEAEETKCLTDKLFNFTEPVNNFFNSNEGWRKAFTIISSLFIDLSFLGLSTYFLLFIRSWRIIIVFTLVYLLRFILQFMWVFSYPEGYAFSYPGFPSLFVNYNKSADFFFSGQVSLPIIAALEFHKNGMLAIALICLFISLFEAFFMLFIRGHYSIDLLCGLVFPHYIYLVTDQYVHYLDNAFFKAADDLCLVSKTEFGNEESTLHNSINYPGIEDSSLGLDDESKLLNN